MKILLQIILGLLFCIQGDLLGTERLPWTGIDFSINPKIDYLYQSYHRVDTSYGSKALSYERLYFLALCRGTDLDQRK